MTLLQTIMFMICVIGLCFAIAKYNKNDNLFWILLISLFAGMAGGALANKFDGKNESEKANFDQVYIPTQVSPAISVDFYAQLGDALALRAKPASKVIEIPERDIKVEATAPSKISGEIRGQPTEFDPFDTS